MSKGPSSFQKDLHIFQTDESTYNFKFYKVNALRKKEGMVISSFIIKQEN